MIHNCHTAIMTQLYFLDIFNWNLKMNLLLYKCPQFLEINGCSMLQHSGDHWKLLIIVTRNYLSYMWWGFWICHWQEKHIAQFQGCLSTHESYKIYTSSLFLLRSPWLLKPDTNLFGHSSQVVEKQLLTQCSFITFTIVNQFYDFPVSQWFLKLIGTLNINDWSKY